MQAVEFHANIKNGMIEIPAQYQHRLTENVRVIILTEDADASSNRIEELLASPLKMADFKPLSRGGSDLSNRANHLGLK